MAFLTRVAAGMVQYVSDGFRIENVLNHVQIMDSPFMKLGFEKRPIASEKGSYVRRIDICITQL